MFRIRRIHDDVIPINRQAIEEVRRIFSEQFPLTPSEDVDTLPDKLKNPFRRRFRTVLYVAENARGQVRGFAVLLHEPEIEFCYLDYIAAAKSVNGRGVGAALYQHLREEVTTLRAKGLFFDCLPDDEVFCRDPLQRKQNADRLRFYEQYGVRPILGTAYQTPVPGGGSDNLPYLVYDGLDREPPLRAPFLRQVMRAILERKYGDICPPEYVDRVIASIRDDPVRLRELRYLKPGARPKLAAARPGERIALVVSEKHKLHHIRERGYVEAPVRIEAIQSELEASGLFERLPAHAFGMEHIVAVHERAFVDYLRKACANVPAGRTVYPYVFPIRNATRPPKDLSIRAGYYCIDTFTPIHTGAFAAAKAAVDGALSAAEAVLRGWRLAYALVRPPGHHAERKVFGGFCYFNNAAIAAHYLSRHGRVAILDVDYHHGNGQQDIFYERADVFTVSLHADAEFSYPYFTGFADERGAGAGEGFNLNLPLPETLAGPAYLKVLEHALKVIRQFEPTFLVVALGLDPAKGDPTGTWALTAKDFEQNGFLIGRLGLPTLVVQEGGYRTRTLGINARHFFVGLWNGSRSG